MTPAAALRIWEHAAMSVSDHRAHAKDGDPAAWPKLEQGLAALRDLKAVLSEFIAPDTEEMQVISNDLADLERDFFALPLPSHITWPDTDPGDQAVS